MHRSALVALPAAALLVLSGCSLLPSLPGGTTEILPVGTCLDAQDGFNADWTATVDCTEDHLYDVLGSTEWPGMDDAIAADGAESVWERISDGSLTAFWDWVDHPATGCRAVHRDAVGLGDLTIAGMSGTDLRLAPMGYYRLDASPASLEVFVDGDHRVLCSMTWLTDLGDSILVAAEPGIDITGYATGEYPASHARGCFTRSGPGEYVTGLCDVGHNGEYLFYFDGGVAFPEFVATFRPDGGDIVTDDYAPLDAFCTELIDAVHPGVLGDGWDVWGDHAAGTGHGWEGFDGTVVDGEVYQFTCSILRTERTDLVTGSVVVGDVAPA